MSNLILKTTGNWKIGQAIESLSSGLRFVVSILSDDSDPL